MVIQHPPIAHPLHRPHFTSTIQTDEPGRTIVTLMHSSAFVDDYLPPRTTAADTVIEFTTRRSPIQVAEAFGAGMDLPIGVDSPVFGQLYIASITSDGIDFVSSSSRGRAFASRLDVSAPKRTGSVGVYRVVEWNASIGTDSDMHQLEIVERRVRLVLESLGATIT